MKKIILSFAVAGIILTTYSCRESTQDKTKDAVEAIGEDIEDGTRRAAEEVEKGAEKVKKEIDEEIHETDDHIQQEEPGAVERSE
ncbi:hypothetical protein OQ279_13380 [Salinimicrobium sp. MT39]|uniref:YtxH domain-containing protein n=1 Tax=Salinimicrobium profundisediminis TaxID=2994553 RepID=A0A9X3CYG0_9FLAO|nr:hypothetical protein [Salinimicrobium profundisediminis]MCX2839141.1 hypothetical protein [Salinimicrobium profundisediminis]